MHKHVEISLFHFIIGMKRIVIFLFPVLLDHMIALKRDLIYSAHACSYCWKLNLGEKKSLSAYVSRIECIINYITIFKEGWQITNISQEFDIVFHVVSLHWEAFQISKMGKQHKQKDYLCNTTVNVEKCIVPTPKRNRGTTVH